MSSFINQVYLVKIVKTDRQAGTAMLLQTDSAQENEQLHVLHLLSNL